MGGQGVEPTILCPSCNTEIKLTESLAAPLIAATKRDFEQKLRTQSAEFAKREQSVKDREAELAREKESLDATLAEKLKAERDKLAADAAKQAKVLKDQQEALAKEKEAVDATVAEKLKTERDKLAADSAKREKALKEQQEALVRQKEELETTLADKLKQERAKIAADEARKAKLALGDDLEQKAKEIADLNAVLKARDEKLAEAQKAQAELIKMKRDLEDARREMELTIETRVTESLAKTREQAKKEAEESLSLKLIEKQTTIESMQRQIEELKKRAEQGSQQLQGEALELQLESVLAGKFPHDTASPVPKGEHGGDILQRIMLPTGVACGAILWETKRTRNWGCPSSAKTNGRPRPKSPSSSPPSFPKALRRSTRSTASGSSTRAPSCRWRCRCGTCSSRSTAPARPAKGSRPRWR